MAPGVAPTVPVTYADIGSLAEAIDFRPTTDPEVGIRQFVQWYQHYQFLENSSPFPLPLEEGTGRVDRLSSPAERGFGGVISNAPNAHTTDYTPVSP